LVQSIRQRIEELKKVCEGLDENTTSCASAGRWSPKETLSISEFGGGLAWILGLLTLLASLGIAFTMAVAFSFHAFMRGDPFVSMTGGPSFELAALYFSFHTLNIITSFILCKLAISRRQGNVVGEVLALFERIALHVLQINSRQGNQNL
jgi:uncharacterized membrane protein YphA (DoxX/SURF4 family)